MKSTFSKETLSAEYMTIEEVRRLLHEDLKNVEQILKKNAENNHQ